MEKGGGDSSPTKALIIELTQPTDENEDVGRGSGGSDGESIENATSTMSSAAQPAAEPTMLRRTEELTPHQSQPGAYHVGVCGSSQVDEDEMTVGAETGASTNSPTSDPSEVRDSQQPHEAVPGAVLRDTEPIIEAVVVDEDNVPQRRRSLTSLTPVYDAQALEIDDEIGSGQKQWCTRSRTLFLCCLVLVVFAIGGVVGGVVGSRNKDESPPSASPECEAGFNELVYNDTSVTNEYWDLFQALLQYGYNDQFTADPNMSRTFLVVVSDFPNQIADICVDQGGVVTVSTVTQACFVKEEEANNVYVLENLPICTSKNCSTVEDIVTTFQPYFSDLAQFVSGDEICSTSIDPDSITVP